MNETELEEKINLSKFVIRAINTTISLFPQTDLVLELRELLATSFHILASDHYNECEIDDLFDYLECLEKNLDEIKNQGLNNVKKK